MMERTFFGIGAALAFLAVAAGAFATHSLRDRLTPQDMDTFQTAARYHMYHALALLGVAYAAYRFGSGLVTAAGWLFVAGIVIFSGSLYLLSLTGVRVLGAVAPVGGAALLAGWVCLLVAVLRK
jgi:uncharacterized membrane protein YgdD (TMEM256/DUF423 family)